MAFGFDIPKVMTLKVNLKWHKFWTITVADLGRGNPGQLQIASHYYTPTNF